VEKYLIFWYIMVITTNSLEEYRVYPYHIHRKYKIPGGDIFVGVKKEFLKNHGAL